MLFTGLLGVLLSQIHIWSFLLKLNSKVSETMIGNEKGTTPLPSQPLSLNDINSPILHHRSIMHFPTMFLPSSCAFRCLPGALCPLVFKRKGTTWVPPEQQNVLGIPKSVFFKHTTSATWKYCLFVLKNSQPYIWQMIEVKRVTYFDNLHVERSCHPASFFLGNIDLSGSVWPQDGAGYLN